MVNINDLATLIITRFPSQDLKSQIAYNELTIEIPSHELIKFCLFLHDDLAFDLLVDLCGVDYLDYGVDQWATENTTFTGFSRGVQTERVEAWQKPRFAVVYHLLSLANNYRLRLRTFATGNPISVPSVTEIWQVANWFEREAYDLFGIIFVGHPDLRRILTDYGFIGHPFRKDFPLIGTVEPRYDATEGRVIYEPVSIKPRTLVPKVIREDNRYDELANQDKRNA